MQTLKPTAAISGDMRKHPTPSMFLDDGWPLFRDGVHNRIKHLIKGGVWEGLQEVSLNNWLRGFKEYSDVNVGIVLLDNLIYRSNKQCMALMEHALVESTPSGDAKEACCLGKQLLNRLVSSKDLGILVSPVVEAGRNPAKSGPGILRMAAQHLKLDKRKMVSAKFEDLQKRGVTGVDTLLLFDDFAGTGLQFCRYAKETLKYEELTSLYKDLKIIYVVAAIHKAAINEINHRCPKICIYYGELLTKEHDFLSDESLIRYGKDAPIYIRDVLAKLGARVGFPSSDSHSSKFSSLHLCYGFQHGTPNNTLPIFWCQTGKWHPLLVR